MTHERRRDIRVRVVLPAERVLHRRSEPIEIVEVSYRGLQLRMPAEPVLNELMKLRLALPGRTIFLFAVPLRATPQRGALAVGCKLFALNGADKDEWQDFVGKLLRADAKAA